ncbi:MAG: hypothetical protein ACM3N9_03860 [Syntrophothermus sp.]
MDTRIGYPNEHLAKDVPPEMASPMYATGIGLVVVGIERYEKEKQRLMANLPPEPVIPQAEELPVKKEKEKKEKKQKNAEEKQGKRFTDSFREKIQKWFEEENE